MASVSTTKSGDRILQFLGLANGAGRRKRETLRLGPMPIDAAQSIAMHVESLVAAKLSARPIDPVTALWTDTIDASLAARLAERRLIPPRQQFAGKSPTLGEWLTTFEQGRPAWKPATKTNFGQARGWLLKHFGPERLLGEITPGDADEWRLWLAEQKLGRNTIRRHCGRAKSLFRAAARKQLIATNPFEDMADTSVRANEERDRFVTMEETQKVLDACTDAQWRLLFALARFGGLRCPSECRALKWANIDWERGRMTVHSPKTAHHDGKSKRIVPLFPELLPHLEAAFEAAADGEKWVVTIPTIRKNQKGNAGTRLGRIVTSAGLEPWPKIFQNLRSTRETELAGKFPLHVVCRWIGNSPKVAMAHYLRVTEADYERAARGPLSGGAAGGAANDAPEALHDGCLVGAGSGVSNGGSPMVATSSDGLGREVADTVRSDQYPRRDSNTRPRD